MLRAEQTYVYSKQQTAGHSPNQQGVLLRSAAITLSGDKGKYMHCSHHTEWVPLFNISSHVLARVVTADLTQSKLSLIMLTYSFIAAAARQPLLLSFVRCYIKPASIGEQLFQWMSPTLHNVHS